MIRSLRTLALTMILGAPLLAGGPAQAGECLGVTVPDSVKVGGADLALNGMGIRKATFLAVKVYVAALYLPQKSSDGSAILASDQPWRLVLTFVRDVDGSDIRDAFADGFKKAAGANLAGLQSRVDTLLAGVTDFKVGQSLAFTHSAGAVGVEANGANGATIKGADFAASLLAIWIGAQPPNEDLKTGLLGGPCA